MTLKDNVKVPRTSYSSFTVVRSTLGLHHYQKTSGTLSAPRQIMCYWWASCQQPYDPTGKDETLRTAPCSQKTANPCRLGGRPTRPALPLMDLRPSAVHLPEPISVRKYISGSHARQLLAKRPVREQNDR